MSKYRIKFDLQLFAHKQSTGSTQNGRDSESNRLGVKEYGGEFVKPGYIIIRQRGTKFRPGKNVGLGKDHTIFSKVFGYVKFEGRQISVLPAE